VARRRDDIYFTIASIADFQPHVTSGEVPPPANPLVISQPCIRFSDVDSVGRSGRHLTIFEMMGHHAFNSREGYIYWTEETVEFKKEDLTQLENLEAIFHDFHNLSEGTIINGRYKIINKVGKGGVGIVYRAYDLILNNYVALKFINPTMTYREKKFYRIKRTIYPLKRKQRP